MKGTVTYQNIEGGFWGIRGDDNVEYLPVNGLPSDVRRDGTRISFEPEPASGISLMMWGRPVNVRRVEAISTNRGERMRNDPARP